MDEILLNEKRYISAKQAARQTGYTKDYIGQLCRSGRLPARMVGRNWYIEEGAVVLHQKHVRKDAVQAKAQGASESQNEMRIDRVRSRSASETAFPMRYANDGRPLMPMLVKRRSAPASGVRISEGVSEGRVEKMVGDQLASSVHIADARVGHQTQTTVRREHAPSFTRESAENGHFSRPLRLIWFTLALISIAIVSFASFAVYDSRVYRQGGDGSHELESVKFRVRL